MRTERHWKWGRFEHVPAVGVLMRFSAVRPITGVLTNVLVLLVLVLLVLVLLVLVLSVMVGVAPAVAVPALPAVDRSPPPSSDPSMADPTDHIPSLRFVVPFDGSATTTQRIAGLGVFDTAVRISQARYKEPGGGPDGRGEASRAVLARNDVFADSLSGSALTTDGPLLFTEATALPARTADELRRILVPGAEVMLLGGVDAISAGVADAIADMGFTPVRLAGSDRIATALAIADEVHRRHGSSGHALIARADDWADSVTAGVYANAARTPVLVTDRTRLDPRVSRWLEDADVTSTIVLGGTAALSDDVLAAAPNPRRVGGIHRAHTATEVAEWVMGMPHQGVRSYTIIDGDAPDAWAYGLAASGLAGFYNTPLLMVRSNTVPAVTAAELTQCGAPAIDLLVIGDTELISDHTVALLNANDGVVCPNR